jgi:GDP-4-dehydro-6-deoxy-D-mannose reductase
VKALVTGAGGFVGQWLCRALLRGGWTVTGTTLGFAPEPGVLTPAELMQMHWRGINLRPGTDRRTLDALVEREEPDAVFHLAGVSFVPAADADPLAAFDTNVGAAVRLIEALRHWRAISGREPRLLVIGSAEQYGRYEASEMPLSERHECRPRTFYAATKCAQEHFALSAARHDGLHVVATRSFNHSGRGQAPGFLLPALVARALAARVTPGATVAIGNTGTIRDFLHVEDVVGAYIALVGTGRPGEVYNVCSGEGVTVGEVAAEVLARAGVSGVLRPDPALQRSVDVPVLVGDNSKLRADTGWAPSRTRADIIDDLLNAAS